VGAEELRRQVRRADEVARRAGEVEEHGVDPHPAVGRPAYAQQWISRFGFDPEKHPPYLTMALGSGSVTPMQMSTAYGVFATGGYRVNPMLITKVTDARGKVLQSLVAVAWMGYDQPKSLGARIRRATRAADLG
jgi:membrane carboxypeptidase/penicillin-binding protein